VTSGTPSLFLRCRRESWRTYYIAHGVNMADFGLEVFVDMDSSSDIGLYSQ
ncbi:uncharacterized protein METZ01_LOCUS275386, partial [marine metagenome]